MRFEELKWPDLKAIQSSVVLVPLGSIEQHGYHLPLATDTIIVSEIAQRLEAREPLKITLLPTQWLGHSPHHQHFGCVSADMRPYMDMIRALCHSLVSCGARKIFLLNGHGGNDVPVKAALREVKSEFSQLPDLYVTYAAYWSLAADAMAKIRTSPKGGMGHACEMETSILLTLRPDLVDMSAAKPDGPYDKGPWRVADMLAPQPYYMVNEFNEFSETGVIGMPQYASTEKGELFLSAIVDSVANFIAEFSSWSFQEQPSKGK